MYMAGDSDDKAHKIIEETALMAGRMLSEANAEARRVEETMQCMMRGNYCNVQVLAHPADILLIWRDAEGNEHMKMERVYHHCYHLGCIDEIHHIARAVAQYTITVEDAYELLLQRSRIPPNTDRQRFGIILLGAAFAMVFEGGILDIVITLGIGMIYALLWELHTKFQGNELFHFLIASTLISVCISFASVYLPIYGDIVMISSIMPMVPGIGITSAFMEILNKDYVSGLARLVEAFMQALSIASGIGFGILIKDLCCW